VYSDVLCEKEIHCVSVDAIKQHHIYRDLMSIPHPDLTKIGLVHPWVRW